MLLIKDFIENESQPWFEFQIIPSDKVDLRERELLNHSDTSFVWNLQENLFYPNYCQCIYCSLIEIFLSKAVMVNRTDAQLWFVPNTERINLTNSFIFFRKRLLSQ